MIQELYSKIAEALSELCGCTVAHIDLWNQNVEFIEEDEAWDLSLIHI